MRDKKQRVRTGCLTCRARRVKCDEHLPKCRRCLAANVDCAGYEQRRVIVPNNSHNKEPRQTSSPSKFPSQNLHLPKSESLNEQLLCFSTNQTPLVALPSNPRPNQQPGPGARHVLGYHQALFRTVPMLFAPENLGFWRDEIFQEVWNCEYLYLTIVGLGNIHRAALMTASRDERAKANGLDTKIAAVQIYTQTLQKLSNNLEEAKETPTLLVATLCLMAYFESLSGNIPAFIGRAQAADYYLTTLLPAHASTNGHSNPPNRELEALQDCLQLFRQTCYISLPLDRIHLTTERSLDRFDADPSEQTSTFSAFKALDSLMDLISEVNQIKQLVWSPIVPYARDTPINVIRGTEERLKAWKNAHLHLIPELDTDSALNSLLIYKWRGFGFPPPTYTSTTRNTSLASAHFSFYIARMKWARLCLGETTDENQLSAEFYFYEALRHAASHFERFASENETGDPYIPCEALNVGLLPVLHITGLCSPQITWLKWIKELCDQIPQEGVLKGHTFATNLHCLQIFENRRQGDVSSPRDHFPNPAERIICQLIPETDGRHFISFFAAPAPGSDPQQEGLSAYRVIGSARWKCGHGEGPCTPQVKTYENDNDNYSSSLERFSMDWLYNTNTVLDWLSWSQEKEFRFDRAILDHISGTRLLLAVDEVTPHAISPL
ncbi:hypothetical protein DM02DRAFT_669420 [Periconia macrospinosa]|uniref:Zn(2)-C6 fungal-type domain-containing protein n=1 Tax=Periconia macrospinosa TaxID=97972 RepID=A0A2V1E0I3_9PLEO|nr:hypothetical protein DM02DRAFT_669420 [Periconia macrospinosa]